MGLQPRCSKKGLWLGDAGVLKDRAVRSERGMNGGGELLPVTVTSNDVAAASSERISGSRVTIWWS